MSIYGRFRHWVCAALQGDDPKVQHAALVTLTMPKDQVYLDPGSIVQAELPALTRAIAPHRCEGSCERRTVDLYRRRRMPTELIRSSMGMVAFLPAKVATSIAGNNRSAKIWYVRVKLA